METSKEIINYKKKTNIIFQNAESLVIKNEEDLKSAVDILSEIKSTAKNIQIEKEKWTEPATKILQQTRKVFNPIEKLYNSAEVLIKGKILDYNSVVEKRASAKIEKIAQKVENGKMDLVKAAAQVENITPAKSVDGEKGKISYRIIKKIIINDISKLPCRYLLPNNSLIRADISKGVKIQGIEIREEKIIASS